MAARPSGPPGVLVEGGTVFLDEDGCCLQAMADAFSILAGVDVSPGEFARLGDRCGRERAHEVAQAHGVELDVDAWEQCVERLYFARFDPRGLDDCERLEEGGAPVALVTGMPASVAQMWMHPLGLERLASR